MLAALGLDEATEAAYRMLLRRPDLSVDELAGAVRLPAEQVRQGLADLLGRGLLRPHPDAPDRVIPVRPDVAVGGLVEVEQQRLAREQADLAAVAGGLDGLMGEYTAGLVRAVPAVELEVVTGLPAIRGRIEEMLAATRGELLGVSSAFEDTPETVDATRTQDFPLLKRGVVLRTLYPESLAESPLVWAYAQEAAAEGEQIRLAVDLPPRLLISDRSAGVLPLDEEDPARGVLMVTAPSVVSALVALFEASWAAARPAFGQVGAELTGRERRLVDLLAAGAKDETVARQLGVTARTVRRDVAVLTDLLAARTRFQAGVLAARRGWV